MRLLQLLAGALLVACFVVPLACHKSTNAAAPDGGGDALADGARCYYVDDGGVTHGCTGGGMGPGDRDDGGDAGHPELPDLDPNATNLPYGSWCLDNAQCSSNLCFWFQVKGQFCTQFCDGSADCPPASLGCGGMGVCRVGN
jgi:hypothetical protein